MAKRIVAVTIAGREYRIRSDTDEVSLHKVAATVDVAMTQIRERTGTVDSLDVATLTALNLARDLLVSREKLALQSELSPMAEAGSDPDRVTALIEMVQSALSDSGGGSGREHAEGGDGGTTGSTPAHCPGADPAPLLTLSSERRDGEDDSGVLQPS